MPKRERWLRDEPGKRMHECFTDAIICPEKISRARGDDRSCIEYMRTLNDIMNRISGKEKDMLIIRDHQNRNEYKDQDYSPGTDFLPGYRLPYRSAF